MVDGHVHMGWTYDYFAQRHGWRGLDGQNGRIVGIVNNEFFNAYAYSPPYGPEGAGVYVFGQRRVPDSETTQPRLFDRLDRVGRLGPPSFEWEGETHTCTETSFNIRVEPDVWKPFPAYCVDGRFVLASLQASAVSEAYSDIFAVSTGFFHEGPALRAPTSTAAITEARCCGRCRIPGRRTSTQWPMASAGEFAAALVNDRYYQHSGALFLNGELFHWSQDHCCYGAEHWNSTILSHAFYFAIEGGTNLGTQLTVEGAGASNRDQVERIFFRALTELMPQATSFPLAADVIRQAAADLAAGTPVQRAVEEALVAVGLPPLPAT